jgi:hypothetical protein
MGKMWCVSPALLEEKLPGLGEKLFSKKIAPFMEAVKFLGSFLSGHPTGWSQNVSDACGW